MVLWKGVHTYLPLTDEVAHEVGKLMLIEWSRRHANKDHAGIRGGVHTYLPLTDEVAHEVGRLMLTEGSEDMSSKQGSCRHWGGG